MLVLDFILLQNGIKIQQLAWCRSISLSRDTVLFLYGKLWGILWVLWLISTKELVKRVFSTAFVCTISLRNENIFAFLITGERKREKKVNFWTNEIYISLESGIGNIFLFFLFLHSLILLWREIIKFLVFVVLALYCFFSDFYEIFEEIIRGYLGLRSPLFEIRIGFILVL